LGFNRHASCELSSYLRSTAWLLPLVTTAGNIMFYRLLTAAELVDHRGMVVLDAPRPTSQPAQEAESASGDSR
jgi:hypothetical protein